MYVCVLYIYNNIHSTHTHTHILCKQKLLFWMRLIAINYLTELIWTHYSHVLLYSREVGIIGCANCLNEWVIDSHLQIHIFVQMTDLLRNQASGKATVHEWVVELFTQLTVFFSDHKKKLHSFYYIIKILSCQLKMNPLKQHNISADMSHTPNI